MLGDGHGLPELPRESFIAQMRRDIVSQSFHIAPNQKKMPSKVQKKNDEEEKEEEPAPLVVIVEGNENDEQIKQRNRQSSINNDSDEK